MNGEHVGEWAFSRYGGHTFRYDDSWLRNPLRRPLSLSLPLEQGTDLLRGTRVEAFFDNLLPDSEGEIRKRLAHKFGTGTRAIELLAEIGKDCVGAIQLFPADAQPPDIHRIEAEVLTDAQVEHLIDTTVTDPAPGQPDDEDLRISIAMASKSLVQAVGTYAHNPYLQASAWQSWRHARGLLKLGRK
jgi:serine/threonine-protein kinase HipA